MRLSRTVTYALHATLQLAQQENRTPVPSSHLASAGDMPERFLLQILRNLVTHGILRSTRGVDGGYSLVRPADEVSVLDVIEAIEGPMDVELNLGEGFSQSSQDRLHTALSHVTTNARQHLKSIKIAHLLKPPVDAAM